MNQVKLPPTAGIQPSDGEFVREGLPGGVREYEVQPSGCVRQKKENPGSQRSYRETGNPGRMKLEKTQDGKGGDEEMLNDKEEVVRRKGEERLCPLIPIGKGHMTDASRCTSG